MIFNAVEVFEIAEQIERNGQTFYRKAIELVSDPEVGRFLKSLAEMEDKHEELFNKLEQEVAAVAESEFPDAEDQLIQYLHSFADKQVFDTANTPAQKISENTTVEDIFDIAIEFERSSVIFFTIIKDMVPARLGKEKIEILIQEEIDHVVMLCNQLNTLGYGQD